MKFIVVGVGPGDAGLITYRAVETLRNADLVLWPLSAKSRSSVAQGIVLAHAPDLQGEPVVFPMVRDAEARDVALQARLEELRPRWERAETVALPVIGDSALYATGAWLFDVWKKLVPDLELHLVPGVSAHSLSSSRAGRFLAMGEDVLAIVPATEDEEAIIKALQSCRSAALYKPMALRDRLASVVQAAGPWREMIRLDRAGLSDEVIHYGEAAIAPAEEYLSTLLLWR